MNRADPTPQARHLLLDGLRAALDATGGRESVRRRLAGEEEFAPRFAFAVGKAAPAMMEGAFESLGSCIERALVVTKHGHTGDALDSGWPVDVVESSHPVPDASSLARTLRLSATRSPLSIRTPKGASRAAAIRSTARSLS